MEKPLHEHIGHTKKTSQLRKLCVKVIAYRQLQLGFHIFYNLGFRGNFYNLIKNFLENRSYRIKVGDLFSTYACIERGVPQGSILSSILYSIYVHDFASIHPNVIQYADDSTIILSLIELGKNITKYMSAHYLKINVTKTEFMLFKENESVELEFLNERLNSVPKAKFLGIKITPDLKFDHHIENNIIPICALLLCVQQKQNGCRSIY